MGIYDTEEIAQRKVADCYNLMWEDDSEVLTAHVIETTNENYLPRIVCISWR